MRRILHSMNTAKRKITVQVLAPLAAKLNDLSARACLNRDSYLDVLLHGQAKMLVSDADGRRNSDQARAFAKRWFGELKEFRVLTLNLSAGTARAIDDACEAVNCWRDVFINRVLLLLVAKTPVAAKLLEIESPEGYEEVREAIRLDAPALYTGPRLAAIGDFVREDPFTSFRIAMESEYPETKGRIYEVVIGKPSGQTPAERGFAGLNPLLPDEVVPNTPAAIEQQRMVAELLEEFESPSLGKA